MGNCVQGSSSSSGAASGCAGGGEGGRPSPAMQLQRRRSEEAAMEDRGPAAPSVVKMKMVLTKGELGWLVARLKAGDRRLEHVLQEMARKKRENGWRPSLESIVETSSARERRPPPPATTVLISRRFHDL